MAKKEDIKKGENTEEVTEENAQSTTSETGEQPIHDHEKMTENEESPKENSLEDKMKELNDKYLRLYSDFDNFRKRTMKEKADLISSASSGVVKDLLPVIDDFERAIQSNQTTEDLEGLKEGFLLIYNKMKNILTSKGLKPMESKGLPFDADLHEAVTNIPAPSEEEKGKVVDEIEKGYYLNEKVIRYAKVVVGQ